MDHHHLRVVIKGHVSFILLPLVHHFEEMIGLSCDAPDAWPIVDGQQMREGKAHKSVDVVCVRQDGLFPKRRIKI